MAAALLSLSVKETRLGRDDDEMQMQITPQVH